MTLEETMDRLRTLGDDKLRAMNVRRGAGENQFGVKMGDVRTLAKSIKLNPKLAVELWETGNVDAMFLAVLLMKPKEIPLEELERRVRSVHYSHLADWLNSYVVKLHPEKETLRKQWMEARDPMLQRAGWSLTAERIVKSPDGLDLPALLDRIEREMGHAPEAAQWTMNFCLAEIGIHFPNLRERALAIGERLGLYRDYPTSKGCTSPFAPAWINEMVSRQG